MNKQEIVSLTYETIVNHSPVPKVLKEKGTDPVEQYQREIAQMLILSWKNYQSGKYTLDDFLMILRDFLNILDTGWPVSLMELPEENRFGIRKGMDGYYYASLNEIVKYIPDKFLEDVYHGRSSEGHSFETGESLNTDRYIEQLTGFEKFRSEAQKLAVYGALRVPPGYTELITLPTGGGKSLITQAVAFQEPGLTIVVMPTVSLTIDQMRGCRSRIQKDHLDELIQSYTGGDDDAASINLISQKKLQLLFASPETLMKNPRFQEVMSVNASWIRNIIIDEAHLVVEWGDAFRPDFQCLQSWRRELLSRNPGIRTYLMSATLTDTAIQILENLFVDDDRLIEIRCDALRQEPRIATVLSETRLQQEELFLKMVRSLPHPMIVYVNSPDEAEERKEKLKRANITNFRLYTGVTRKAERKEINNLWSAGELPLIIATNAFGVGVDKPNVRTVLHQYLPANVDAYYQELGRGGRDGIASLSVMNLIANGNASYNETWTKVRKQILSEDKIYDRWKKIFFEQAERIRGTDNFQVSTGVLPSYQDERDETGSVGAGNVKWNIYVLLLLQRYGLINIHRIERDRNTYIFEISIEDDRLRSKGPELDKLIQTVREKERATAKSDLDKLWKMVKNSAAGKECWSELFTDCYPLADECCAGCTSHIEPLISLDTSVLKEKVKEPVTSPCDQIQILAGTRPEILLQFDDFSDFGCLEKFGMQVLVTDEEENIKQIREGLTDQLPCMICSFREFRGLVEESYFVSGVIGILYSHHSKEAEEEFRQIRRILSPALCQKQHVFLMHISRDDFPIGSDQKKLSAFIQGPTIESDELNHLYRVSCRR